MIATNKILGYVSGLGKMFTKPQMGNFITMIVGLFSEGKKTLLSISNKVIGAKNQSNLNRFLNDSNWNERELNDLRLSMLQKNKNFKIKGTGYFIIDDTITEEFGKYMVGVGKYFDHTTGTYKYARNILMLYYVEDDICYPVDFRIYYKVESIGKLDFKTKNELALEMIFEHMPKKKEDQPITLFDSWFSGKDFLKSLDDNGYMYITMGKSDRNVYIDGQKLKVQDLFKQTNKVLGQIEGYKKTLTFIKGEYREESQDKRDIYLISNINGLKHDDYIEKYDNRFGVEVGFKDFKQLFGWKDSAFEKPLAVVRMIYATFFAYTISMKESFKHKIKGIKTSIGNTCSKFRKESIKELLKKVHALGVKNVPLQSVFKRYRF